MIAAFASLPKDPRFAWPRTSIGRDPPREFPRALFDNESALFHRAFAVRLMLDDISGFGHLVLRGLRCATELGLRWMGRDQCRQSHDLSLKITGRMPLIFRFR